MEPYHRELISEELERTCKRLEQLLTQLSIRAFTANILQDSLIASHTLKVLAAVYGDPSLENYAAQLEQLFLRHQDSPLRLYPETLVPELLRIRYAFQTSQKLAQEGETENKHPSKRLSQSIERLFEAELKHAPEHSKLPYEREKNLKKDILLEDLIKSFSPWLYNASEGLNKKISFEIQVSEALTIPQCLVSSIQTITTHLLRNALVHGIEPSAVRIMNGKPEIGRIAFKALQHQQWLIFSISDDGHGFQENTCSVFGAASNSPMALSEGLNENSLIETSIYATNNLKTGLNIGLHIVRSQIEKMNGEFSLQSDPKNGTTATIRIPC